MTSSEFEQWYANNSGVSVQALRDHGLVVVRCECGEEGCQGWASLSKETADFYMEKMPGVYGYHYPAEGE